MCGIAGIVGKLATQEELEKILKPIAHRGELSCRNEVKVLTREYALGTHRLAIVDPKQGKQPKTTKDDSIICVLNGEIYNHHVIRKKLSLYYEFHSMCDSEVVLYSYCHWGKDFVNELDGKFALAIFDKRKECLILARDPMGVKPLYFSRQEDSWFFSSEVKSLSHLSGIQKIESIAPGAIWCNGEMQAYFKLGKFNSIEKSYPKSNALEELDTFLKKAVSKRIPKEAPAIACLLSGGIDSSIITFLASRIHNNVTAYTLAAPNKESGDLEAAKTLCKEFNILHKIISPSILEMQAFYLKHGVYMTESFEPVLVRNAVSYHFLCRAVVNDGFKYCLNGEGADELFGGYDFVSEAPRSRREEVIEYSLRAIHRTYLQMADRASMYATLEARVPYMDKALVNFCTELPPEFRITGSQNKVILREVYSNILPTTLTQRKKVGMNEGAGYGRNVPTESIYYQAVRHHYEEHPQRYEEDLKIAGEYKISFQLNLEDIEEIYCFARYINFHFNKLSITPVRLHLNTQFKPELIHLV
jgi:asparagine synthase (glutamine-hydrolysing)